MIRFLSFFILFGMTCPAFASHDPFFSGSWDEALLKAKQENKFVFVDCYTQNCSWCKEMDRRTFPDTAVIRELSTHFVAIRRDMGGSEEGRLIRLKFHLNSFPVFLILAMDGKLVNMINGFYPAPEFLQKLQASRQPSSEPAFSGFGIKLDPGFPSYCLDYINSTGAAKNREHYNELAKNDLDTSKNLYGEVSWAIMYLFPDAAAEYNNWTLANTDTLTRLYGHDAVFGRIYHVIFSRVIEAAVDGDNKLLSQALNDCRYAGADSSDMRLDFLLQFARIDSNWTMTKNVVQHFCDTADFSTDGPAYLLNDISWDIYERCDDSAVVWSAVGWMEKACSLYPNSFFLDTYAAVLYKSGQYEKAEIAAKQAIAMEKKEDRDTADTEELLDKIRKQKMAVPGKKE